MTATAINLAADSPQFALARASTSRTTEVRTSNAALDGGTTVSTDDALAYVVRRPEGEQLTARQRVGAMVGAALQEVVRVDILEVEHEIARGEIASFGGLPVTVALPLVLFNSNETPRVGHSYDLQMVIDDGIRRPKLSLRTPDTQALRAEKDELMALVEQFGSL